MLIISEDELDNLLSYCRKISGVAWCRLTSVIHPPQQQVAMCVNLKATNYTGFLRKLSEQTKKKKKKVERHRRKYFYTPRHARDPSMALTEILLNVSSPNFTAV